MNVLVTGGAGYIGSHALRDLAAAGHAPIALDDLSRGHRRAVPPSVPLVVADIRDTDAVEAALKAHRIEAVLHFAALAYVGESVSEPLRYYDNNVAGTLSLLGAMERAGVQRLVFSSTCATYGQPERVPITEETPQRPINPYGRSKLMIEQVLEDHARARAGFAYAALRYFNVAGSASDGSIGEDHEPETHLVPNVVRAALGRIPALTIHGTDYPTPDGTCIRDYIHVEDLVAAHTRVLEVLEPGDARIYNLGTGRGHSVREVIAATEEVARARVPVIEGPRRPGDPAELWADPGKIRRELGWVARHRSLEPMIESAYRWLRDHPEGYGRD